VVMRMMLMMMTIGDDDEWPNNRVAE
jgi:hypothetical protein